MTDEKLRDSWTKLESRVVYENQWMEVREDQVLAPNGTQTIYGHLLTPRAVGVLAITEDQHVVLVGQHRYPVNEYSWEIIEGGLEEGEAPQLGGERELKEEVGVSAKTMIPLGKPFHFTNSRSNEIAYLFLATELTQGKNCPDETELLQTRYEPLDSALQMVDDGSIMDVMTIVALQRYRHLYL